jgi:hypothetical protein
MVRKIEMERRETRQHQRQESNINITGNKIQPVIRNIAKTKHQKNENIVTKKM